MEVRALHLLSFCSFTDFALCEIHIDVIQEIYSHFYCDYEVSMQYHGIELPCHIFLEHFKCCHGSVIFLMDLKVCY